MQRLDTSRQDFCLRVVDTRVAVLIASLASISLSGCQVDIGGQTLPSPYYIYDDVQYFPAGPEFKLTEEARAMQEMQGEEELPLAP